jgi:hypothetical protein
LANVPSAEMVTFSGVLCSLLLAATSVTQVFGDRSARSRSDAAAFEKQFLAGLGLPRRPTISKTRDQFLQKVPFRPKTFQINFCQKIFGKVPPQNNNIHICTYKYI